MPDPIAAIAATFIEAARHDPIDRQQRCRARNRRGGRRSGRRARRVVLDPDASPLGKGQIRYFVDAPGRI